jgi:hypothetical protein
VIEKIFPALADKNFTAFDDQWQHLKASIKESEKQALLTEILENFYFEKYFSFFIKVFDKIIESKVSLNFNIDHWAPSFISLVAQKGSIQLFDYFLRRGADINFIADTYAFDEEDINDSISFSLGSERYATCLDSIQLKYSDDLTVHYNFPVPEESEKTIPWYEIDENEEINIKSRYYFCLVEQAQYLRDLIHTNRMIGHIKELGGRNYSQIVSDKFT